MQPRPGERVLDVGTGIVARHVAARLGPEARVAGVDSNALMLAVARRAAPELAWHEGKAEALPFPDGAFDVVVSQAVLMFIAERSAALREMRRVLAPGGRLGVSVWLGRDAAALFEAFSYGDGLAFPLRANVALGAVGPEGVREPRPEIAVSALKRARRKVVRRSTAPEAR